MRWKGDLSIYTGHPTDAIGAKHLHQYTGTIAEISMQMLRPLCKWLNKINYRDVQLSICPLLRRSKRHPPFLNAFWAIPLLPQGGKRSKSGFKPSTYMKSEIVQIDLSRRIQLVKNKILENGTVKLLVKSRNEVWFKVRSVKSD